VITARVDPHVHLLPGERTAKLMRWLHRGLPGVAIPADITAEGALADLRAAGAEQVVNLLFPLRPGEAEELHRYGAALSARESDVICVAGVHAGDEDPERVVRSAIEDHGMRGLKLHPMVQRFSPGDPALAPAIAALAEYALPLYVHTGFDEWYGWGYDLGELERIAARHPSIPLVLCHCAFPRLEWAAEMARRHPQVWLDTTNVFGSIARAPRGEARERLERGVEDLFEAAPGRIFFGTDYPAAMGSLAELHAQVERPAAMAANAARFVDESFSLDQDHPISLPERLAGP
jgi:predicted TIM-barrel fold metal-dependent hydrolase